MVKNKLKFKTEQELFKEYGQNWRTKRQYHWVMSMDYLLGTEIDEKYFYNFLNTKGEFIMKDDDIIYIPKYNYNGEYRGDWKVFLYQIKVSDKKIDYNTPRKLIYD